MIVGRDAELTELAGAAAQAVSGHGLLVLVDGEAGIGKTRLVTELAERLGRDGVTVAWSACREGGAPPFWPWVQLLRRLPPLAEHPTTTTRSAGADPVERLLAPPESAEPGTPAAQVQVDRFLMFEAVTDQLRATGGPLLIVIEDLHWADEATRRLLAFVAGELSTFPALVVGTYRSGELGTAEVAALRPGRQLPLGGLSADELNQAVGALTGEPLAGHLLGSVQERTGGNPFFAVELVALLRSEGRLSEPLPSATLPGSVRVVLERRLARLPSDTHRVLRAAAVLGREVTLSAVADVVPAEVPVDQIAELLRPAVDARLMQPVERRPGRLTFVHDLVREALEAQLGAGERRELHSRAGSVYLAAAQGDASSLAQAAHHLLEAAALGGPTERAIETAASAARRAMEGLAYEEALTLLSSSLALLDAHPRGDGTGLGRAGVVPVDRVSLLLRQGAAAVAAGSPRVARDAHLAAAQLARQDERFDDLARAALGLAAGTGGFEVQLFDSEQLDLLEEVLGLLPAEDSSLRALVTARLSVALSFVEGDQRRRALAADAVAMARRVEDPTALAAALAAHCDSIAGPDRLPDRLAGSMEIISLAETLRDRPLELLGRRLRLMALAESGDWPGVDDEIVRYTLTSELVRQPLYQWYVPLWRGMRASMAGRPGEAERLNQEVRRVAGLSGSRNASVLAEVQMFVTQVWAGDAARGCERAIRALSAFGAPGAEHPAVPAIRAFSHACQGHVEEVRAVLGTVARDAVRLSRDSEWLATVVYVGHAAVLAGHIEVAEVAYAELVPYAGQFTVDGIGAGCWGSVDAYLGLLARALGREAAARGHFAAAVELDTRAGWALGERSRRWANLPRSDLGAASLAPPAPTSGSTAGASAGRAAPQEEGDAVFRLSGDVWTFGFRGRTTQAKGAKGYHDIATLLEVPGRPVHVVDLVGGGVDPGSSGEVVDRQTLDAYRRRLLEVESDLAEAEAAQDTARAEAHRLEQDMLLDELRAVAGLGGRPRQGSSQVERARKAVTNRVRHAIARIEKLHPELGRHLRTSVKTGTLCCYEPEHPRSWQL